MKELRTTRCKLPRYSQACVRHSAHLKQQARGTWCRIQPRASPPSKTDAEIGHYAEDVVKEPTLDDAPAISERLFSNLNSQTLKHEPGTVLGAALLVAGTTVGAGILALPTVTQPAGFLASTSALALTALFSITTGLLIAEVNINTMCELGGGGVSLVTMAERTLGRTGSQVASLAYTFLHYALLVAYISKAGELLATGTGLPVRVTASAFAVAFAALCYSCSPRLLDQVNGVLVVVVVGTFLGLVCIAGSSIQVEQLVTANWSALPPALPVIALAFVYQNVVPVIASNLEGDVGKVRTAIISGSLIPFLMFVAWEAAILGSVTPGEWTEKQDPLAALQASSTLTAPLVTSFSLLAIATSYIGFILGLTDFLADGLKLPSGQQQAVPYIMTVLPPLVLALVNPDIFLGALDAAGTYGVMTLFGVIPAAMAWSERYGDSTMSKVEVVGGGKPVLLAVGGAACGVIINEVVTTIWSVV